MVERIDTATEATAPEKTEIERTQTLVTETQANVVLKSEAILISTLMSDLAITTASQNNLATLSTTKTLLLLTTCPRFDRTATEVGSKSTKSSAGHTEKLPSKEPSTEYVFPNAAEVQIDPILTN